MSRTSTLILLGVLVILIPFSGVPIQIRDLLTVVFGAVVSSIGLAIRAQEAREQRRSGESAPAPIASPLEASQPESAAPTEMSPV
ncbi:hypothetical protein KGM48_03515 [Patescibacteria group bacterium]|nr:hypothetical protein [Patescibacteria group bacterium]